MQFHFGAHQLADKRGLTADAEFIVKPFQVGTDGVDGDAESFGGGGRRVAIHHHLGEADLGAGHTEAVEEHVAAALGGRRPGTEGEQEVGGSGEAIGEGLDKDLDGFGLAEGLSPVDDLAKDFKIYLAKVRDQTGDPG